MLCVTDFRPAFRTIFISAALNICFHGESPLEQSGRAGEGAKGGGAEDEGGLSDDDDDDDDEAEEEMVTKDGMGKGCGEDSMG